MLDRIVNGRTDLVIDYLASGHPATSTDLGGVSLMQWCAYYGDVSAIRYLLANGETLDAFGANYDFGGAVFHGHWQLCQFLIEHGADVNFPDPETGETPLHNATCKANRPAFNHVIRLLLKHGARPNVATIPGKETGAFMRDCWTKGEMPLHRAAAFGDEEMVGQLLEAGGVVDARDANGETPLSWASWHMRPASILKLLCYGRFRIGPNHVASYTTDHGHGWGGLEANLKGKPCD